MFACQVEGCQSGALYWSCAGPPIRVCDPGAHSLEALAAARDAQPPRPAEGEGGGPAQPRLF